MVLVRVTVASVNRRREAAAAALALVAGVAATLAYRQASAVVQETVIVSRLDTSDATLATLRRTARAATLDVSIEAGTGARVGPGPKSVVIKGQKDRLTNARSLIGVVDALSGNRFFEESNLMRGRGPSPRRVSFSLERMPAAGFINMMAAAAGWPVVQDHSVDGEIDMGLSDVP